MLDHTVSSWQGNGAEQAPEGVEGHPPERAGDAPGLVWWEESETEATVFAFRDGEVDLGRPIEQVQEIETQEQQSVHGGRFTAQAYRVYVARVRR